MNSTRDESLKNVAGNEWDILVIGGGATGLGVAVDAANRGLKTLLLEQDDYAKATSSRSTKLVHGGVRYLEKGDVLLVREALKERGRMLHNAPHLVMDMTFIIGAYRWWEKAFYTIGLTFYDMLALSYGFGRSLPLSKAKVLEQIPELLRPNLRGGIVYHDGQFDDSRMAITLALSAMDAGATCINYMKVCAIEKDKDGKIIGVKAKDMLDNKDYQIKSKIVINCTGVFVDDIIKLDNPSSAPKVRPSRGVHLVVDASFLGGKSALMIPKTMDGRVLFGVPWHGKVILGTTDTPVERDTLEPRADPKEIDFILDQAGKYLTKKPTREDVLCVFAGLRPLAAPTSSDGQKTKEISRSHKIYRDPSGLISITGGKWTTYRAMAEDVLNVAVKQGGLEAAECCTADLKLHGYKENVDRSSWDYVYGTDIDKIQKIIDANPSAKTLLHPKYTFNQAHVIFAARAEQAQTVEDVLARRVRLMFLDARAAISVAPKVAEILALELKKDRDWQDKQVADFSKLANGYIIKTS